MGVKVNEEHRARLKQLVDAVNTPQPGAAPRAVGDRVLIVEDNPHIIEMYAYVLKKLSRVEMGGKVPLDIAFAADGHEALTQFKGAKFDLVLTDLYMPVLDGFGLVARIREDAELKRSRSSSSVRAGRKPRRARPSSAWMCTCASRCASWKCWRR